MKLFAIIYLSNYSNSSFKQDDIQAEITTNDVNLQENFASYKIISVS